MPTQTPEQIVKRRQEKQRARRERLQNAIDLRAMGKSWAEIAAAMGLNNRQRAAQLHAEAVAEGLTPTPEIA